MESPNLNILREIIEYFLKLNSTSLRVLDCEGNTPLHVACWKERMNLEVFKILYNSWPEAIRMSDSGGDLPLHFFCDNFNSNPADELAILKFMLDIDQTLLSVRNEEGELPIHRAVVNKSMTFCKVLIDAYPQCLRVRTNNGELPIHKACRFGKVDTILYMLKLYPESINDVRNGYGNLPIHIAARHAGHDVIESLLKHDPAGASKKTTGNKEQLPLHIASSLYGSQEEVQILFDAYPQAIHIRDGRGRTPLDLAIARDRNEEFGRSIVNFIQAQLVHAQKAKDTTTIMTPDENGWLPLHHALKDKAPLGSIKLLLKGNPSALMTANLNIAFPLHIACEFSPIKVVKYLIELDVNGRILEHCDTNKDSVLHYACRGSNFGVIEYLLGNHASLVSDLNADNKLPLHMLLEGCEDKRVKPSREFTEACFLLLRAHPETVMVQTTRKRRRD